MPSEQAKGEDEEEARKKLLRLLRYRPRSRGEAEQELRKAGYSSSVIAQLISWAESVDLINDERFARLWIADRLMRKPKSKRALGMELKEKGLAEEIIAKALAESAIDERAMIRKLAEERLQRYSADDRRDRYRKMVAFLRGRGFSFHQIQEAMEELLPESE